MGVRAELKILAAEDGLVYRMLLERAWKAAGVASSIEIVDDGDALLDFLRRKGNYAQLAGQRLPDLVLVDLEMPGKGGIEVLQEIRADPDLRHIPVVILSTSRDEEDIRVAEELEGNSFMTKPGRFADLVRFVKSLTSYWSAEIGDPTEPARRETRTRAIRTSQLRRMQSFYKRFAT